MQLRRVWMWAQNLGSRSSEGRRSVPGIQRDLGGVALFVDGQTEFVNLAVFEKNGPAANPAGPRGPCRGSHTSAPRVRNGNNRGECPLAQASAATAGRVAQALS